jgi:TonB family protein
MISRKWIIMFTVLAFGLVTAAAQQKDAGALAEADQLDAQVGALYKQGKFDQALQTAQKELALREKALGADNPAVASVHQNIGELYFAKGKYKEAIASYHQFLEIYEKAAGPNNPKLIDPLGRYLGLLVTANQRAETLDIQKRIFLLDNGFDFDQLAIQKNKNLAMNGLMDGLLTGGPAPTYPRDLRDTGIGGPVVIKIALDEKGHVTSTKTVSGNATLGQAAELAARRSTYIPPAKGGMPASVTGVLIYDFSKENLNRPDVLKNVR